MNNTLDLVRFVTVLTRFAWDYHQAEAEAENKERTRGMNLKASTHKPSIRHKESGLLVYVRLGSTTTINDNVYCGRLRHNIVIDLYSSKGDERNVEEVFELKAAITKEFSKWGEYLKKAGTKFDNWIVTNSETGKMLPPLDSLKYRIRKSIEPFNEQVDAAALEELINLNDGGVPGPYELASSYLENSGLYSMQDFNGVGIELSFNVDENLCCPGEE